MFSVFNEAVSSPKNKGLEVEFRVSTDILFDGTPTYTLDYIWSAGKNGKVVKRVFFDSEGSTDKTKKSELYQKMTIAKAQYGDVSLVAAKETFLSTAPNVDPDSFIVKKITTVQEGNWRIVKYKFSMFKYGRKEDSAERVATFKKCLDPGYKWERSVLELEQINVEPVEMDDVVRKYLPNLEANFILSKLQNPEFPRPYTIKSLTTAPRELTKYTFLNSVYPIKENFVVTNKIDGTHALVCNDTFHGYSTIGAADALLLDGTTILDTEYLDGTFYVFDVLFYKSTDTRSLPFRERLEILKSLPYQGNIVPKTFVPFDEHASVKDDTPDDGYILMDLDQSYTAFGGYKYKPTSTIDFYVEQSEDDEYTLYVTATSNQIQKYGLKPKYNYAVPFDISYGDFSTFVYDGPENIHGKICELTMVDGEWSLVKVRHDRVIDMESSRYFGNNYEIAELIFCNFVDPFTLTDKPSNEYFQVHDDPETAEIRRYNNMVKTQLFSQVRGTKILDIGSGKGQDMHKYNEQFRGASITFTDKDKTALTELISRKHKLIALRNKIRVMIADFDDAAPFTGQDLTVANFSIHYFFGRDNSIMEQFPKAGIITCFDGDKIFEILKTQDEIVLGPNRIVKNYKSDKKGYGLEILVKLPMSTEMYPEFLVFSDFIDPRFEKIPFEEILPKEYANLNNIDKEFVSLYCAYVSK